MKNRAKTLFALLAVVVLLSSTALVADSAPRFQRTAAPSFGQHNYGPALAACNKMTAGDVFWVNADGDEVESYDADVNTITAAFEYDCVPKKAKIVSVWSFEGEQVWTDSEPLKASTKKGVYVYGIATTDESQVGEGEWGVEFLNNKTPLTEGTVQVGGDGGNDNNDNTATDGDTRAVTGVIADKKTKKPIKGAVFIVLNEGVTLDDWFGNDQPDSDIFTQATTDSKGVFKLEQELTVDTVYAVVAGAKGYKPVGGDEFTVTAEDPNPVQLQILLSK